MVDAAELFGRRGVPERAAQAWATLASIALARERPEEAAAAGREASELLANSQTVALRLWSEVQIARVDAGLGDLEGAFRRLDRVLAESRRKGLVLLEYEARLARAQTERAGHPAATGPLAQLAADAEAQGLLRIARKAARSAGLPAP